MDIPIKDDSELNEESSELFEHYRFVVDKGQGLFRIDKFLANKIEGVSRNRLQIAARAGNILVNNVAVKPNYRVKPCEIITILLPEPPQIHEITAEDIPLNIIFEDDEVLIINKPAGMVVHPAYGNYNGTLLNALYFHFQQFKVGLPLLVHRIDKDTTGIMAIACTEFAQTVLARQFFDHTIERRYQALVWGDMESDEGTIRGNIGRSSRDRRLMCISDDPDFGRHAVSHYTVLERFGYVTLVECRLETGRTHQIRAHFSHIGHPLFGDEAYGGKRILKGSLFAKYKQFVDNCFEILPRQALHAKSLAFQHPTKPGILKFDSDLPEDMKAVIEKWRRYTNARQDDSI